jgi:flagellar hook-associated protein 2
MSEKEIENWEKKAKSGLQHSDAALTGMISSLRSALYDTVQGTGLKPSDLGLKSSTWSTSGELQKGQLVFDQAAEIKLRAALQKDPDAVAKVMGTISNATNAETKYKESGFFARINDKMNQYINSTRKGTIKNTETAIISASEKISDMTDLMATKETQYFSQFTRMEKLMSSLNAQSSWFTAQMGG